MTLFKLPAPRGHPEGESHCRGQTECVETPPPVESVLRGHGQLVARPSRCSQGWITVLDGARGRPSVMSATRDVSQSGPTAQQSPFERNEAHFVRVFQISVKHRMDFLAGIVDKRGHSGTARK